MAKVFIMRGIPGSGKSSWIKNNYPGALVFSADHYHMNDAGVYDFKPERAAEAHKLCFKSFVQAIIGSKNDDDIIVVDNTNIRLFEIAPYYRVAEAYNKSFEVSVVEILCTPSFGIARNVHNVPGPVIYNMALSKEPLPSFWNVIYVNSEKS